MGEGGQEVFLPAAEAMAVPATQHINTNLRLPPRIKHSFRKCVGEFQNMETAYRNILNREWNLTDGRRNTNRNNN